MALQSIPLADEAAIAAISGRRPKEWARSIEVSLWQPDGAPPAEEALAQLARLASRAQWRPKLGDEVPGVNYWSTEAALATVRAAAHANDGVEHEVEGEVDGESEPEGCGPPRVEAEMRE